MSSAFITGVTGQDGYYLSALLNEKGYEVYGLVRRNSQPAKLPPNVIEVPGDVTDPHIINIIEEIDPDEIYNLAAMSHVWESFKVPTTTFHINAIGTLNMLEAAKRTGAKFYQASTSELYGNSPPPQNEKTPFYPRSPYGVSKLAAYWLTVNYRESYGLYACNGILFNHESPRRGKDFVTKKVCDYCKELKRMRIYPQQLWEKYRDVNPLKLGNLSSIRDWGHAKDFVKGMWLMMQQNEPDDYVLATGKGRTVKELLDIAFNYIDEDWNDYIEIDPALYRPAEVNELIGDPSKAEAIGWTREYTFEQMIQEMIDGDSN